MGWLGNWLGLDNPARSGGEYEGIDRGNFNMPGYAQQQNRLSGYLGQNDARQAPQIGGYANAGQSTEFANQQHQLADLLMDRAQGNNSVAEQQLRQGLDLSNRQQMAMMAGARPSNAGMAMLTGTQNMANAGMQMSGQAALARAQEAQMAAQGLSGVLGQGRAGDEALNMFNAGQYNQRQLGQAQMNQQQQAMNDAARLGYLGQSLQAAGMQQQGGMNYEQQRTGRFGAVLGVPTKREELIGGISGLAGGMMAGGGG